MAKTAVAFGIYVLLSRGRIDTNKLPLSRVETHRASTVSDAGLVPCLTLGQSVHNKSVGTAFKILQCFLQPVEVKTLMELRHHAPDAIVLKPTVLHRVEDIATAGIVAQHSADAGS